MAALPLDGRPVSFVALAEELQRKGYGRSAVDTELRSLEAEVECVHIYTTSGTKRAVWWARVIESYPIEWQIIGGTGGLGKPLDQSEGTGRATIMVVVRIPKGFGTRFWEQQDGQEYDVVHRFVSHPDEAEWGKAITLGFLRRNGLSEEEVRVMLPIFMGLKEMTPQAKAIFSRKDGLWR